MAGTDGGGIEAAAATVVTALINRARQQHGPIDVLEVPEALHDQLMDEVVEAGGNVGFDSCQVDGVTVVAGGTPDGAPLVRPAGAPAAVPLADDAAS